MRLFCQRWVRAHDEGLGGWNHGSHTANCLERGFMVSSPLKLGSSSANLQVEKHLYFASKVPSLNDVR
jgi:hypothetical protein